jgi:DNA polymerase-1
MIKVADELKEKDYKSKMLLQVHDELVFDVHQSEIDIFKSLIKDKMENAISISVPLDVELGIGTNWLEAH